MAIYHATVKSFSRGKGQSSTAAAAYRAGITIDDELTGARHDYTRRRGVASVDMLAPKGAPDWARDPAACFNASEKAETRANARTARELEVALPAELDEGQRHALALDLGQLLVDRYQVAVLVAVHTPDKSGDERNHHAHILMTPRQIGPDGLGKRACAEFDARGGAGPEAIRILREAVADRINLHLERAQVADRVDHRSLPEQARAAEAEGRIGFAAALAREPTQHEGKTATAMRRRGQESDRGATNDQIKNANRIELRDYLQRLEQEGRLMETPARHTHEAAQRERPAGPGRQVRQEAQPTAPRHRPAGPGTLARPTAPTAGPVAKPRGPGSAGPATPSRGASRFPPRLKAAAARAGRRLRTKTGNRSVDDAMARHEEEMEHLEAEARRAWLDGIDKSMRQSLASVAKLLDPQNRASAHAGKAAYRSDMRELRDAVKQAARDTTRWDRRLKAEADARAALSKAKNELTTWDKENPKPSVWTGSRRDWAERRRKREQRVERRRVRRDAAHEATGPEAQAKYTKQASESVQVLDKLANSMLQRYPIDADRPKPAATPPLPPRPSMTPGRALTPQQQLEEQERQRQAQAFNRPKPRGPSLGR